MMLPVQCALLLAALPAGAAGLQAKPFEWKELLSGPERVVLLGPAIPGCPAARAELLRLLPELKAAGFTHVFPGEELPPGWDEGRPLDPVLELGEGGLGPLREDLRKAGLLILRAVPGLEVPEVPSIPSLDVSASTAAAEPPKGFLKDGEAALPTPSLDEARPACSPSKPFEELWMAAVARLLRDQRKAKVLVLVGVEPTLQDALRDMLADAHGVPSRSCRLLTWRDAPQLKELKAAGLADKRVAIEPRASRKERARLVYVPEVAGEACKVPSDYHPELLRPIARHTCRKVKTE